MKRLLTIMGIGMWLAFAGRADLVGFKTVASLDYWAQVSNSTDGDTYHWTGWGRTGGNWSGGHVYGSSNDVGSYARCPSGGNLNFLELVKLDFTTPANSSIVCGNSMSSFGNPGAINVPAGWTDGWTWKSYNITVLNGVIYWAVERQEQSSPYRAGMSTILQSPDGGAHWCNPATAAANGWVCNSSVWQANGDAPPNSSTGMLWGTVGNANQVARILFIQHCQNQVCSGAPDDADHYLYALALHGDNSGNTIAMCIDKTAHIQDASQWWYYTGGDKTCADTGSWSHTLSGAKAMVRERATSVKAWNIGGVAYINGTYLMVSDYAGDTTTYSQSGHAWGPYFATDNRVAVTRQASIILASYDTSCTGCSAGTRGQIVVAGAMPGHSASLTPTFYLVDVQTGSPAGMTSQRGGTKLRFADGPIPNTLPSKGLKWAFDFGLPLMDQPPIATTGSTYMPEISAYRTCITTMLNVGTGVLLGTTSTTAQVSIGADGTRTAGSYVGHYLFPRGDCTAKLPLSGTGGFTMQVIVTPSSVAANSGYMVFTMYGGSGSPHGNFTFGIDFDYSGGGALEYGDGGPYMKYSSPGWSANNTYLLTLVRSPGVTGPGTVAVYLGNRKLPGVLVGTSDGIPVNLDPDNAVRLGAWDFGTVAYCDPGDYHCVTWPATWSYFAVYNRALTPQEVNRSWKTLKAAMARPPRSLTIQ